jgi:hypothetical protein
MDTTRTSLVVTYARVLGIALTLAGILGFFVNTDQDTVDQLLGLDVNLTHNIVHLATGVLGLVAGFALLTWARTYALVFGIVYTALGVWGLFEGDTFDPLGIFGNVNMADTVLHLVLGVLGIAAYVMSRQTHRETI